MVGDYQVIKLGDINRLKDSENRVLVKITDDDKLPQKVSKKKSKGMEALTSAGFKLFDSLRELRKEIAREESMPPYIIFSDKTLIDMSAKVPLSKAEMLNVSGVGENKYAKYGERFMAVIHTCVKAHPELLKNKPVEEEKQTTEPTEPEIRTGRKNSGKQKAGKQEFFITREEANDFCYADYYYITDIRDELNRICQRDDVKKLPATRITEFLIAEHVISEEKDGRFGNMPGEKGLELGIKTVEKLSAKGNTYNVFMYPKSIQKLIVEHYINSPH